MEKFTRSLSLAMIKCGHIRFVVCDGSQFATMHGVQNMTKRKELQLDKPPVDITEPTETPAERLVRLRVFLVQETAVHGNSIYAQDLKGTISTIENRKW